MNSHQYVEQLLAFIDASPSPWHAADTIAQQLQASGYTELNEQEPWVLSPGGRYYVIRGGSSIIAFVPGNQPLAQTGFKLIGAHTDSPGLRLKPNAPSVIDGFLRLGVEIYGGPILATFTDRDLSLAGRISYRNDDGQITSKNIRFDQPLLRLPNLAIHMNRGVNEDGLKLQKQNELPLILSRITEQQLPKDVFLALLQQQSGINAERILAWELNAYDTQKGCFWGAEQEFFANSQLDNLASCHAALVALQAQSVLTANNTLVCAWFDHEEVGSQSHKGAEGSFLPDVLKRIAMNMGCSDQDYQRALARSLQLSADMAHAYQPNFPMAYDQDHKVFVNQGPVIKVNASQRYSTESTSEALFASWCCAVDVPYQKYSHRCDLPCGSTIGPLTSAKLGILSVDIGNPMWAMHSIRESAGVFDHGYMINVMSHFLHFS
ncbi:M18 family aminopeptidase [Methylocucumis oryzae]|uniref:M18 family aminopeptidase n=1 Tax=Methylocucumis oryzae TaxID=1632867 RepID=A0A0F3IEN1_9GAMM|nr:M18 family aminopeptidase [Methylocucumis oryzae]KJV05201.1 aminopeptidase [Methylocucumis oryzae]